MRRVGANVGLVMLLSLGCLRPRCPHGATLLTIRLLHWFEEGVSTLDRGAIRGSCLIGL